MLLKYFILAAFGILGVSSLFIFPKNTPAGLYEFHYDENGNQVMTLLELANLTALAITAPVTRRRVEHQNIPRYLQGLNTVIYQQYVLGTYLALFLLLYSTRCKDLKTDPTNFIDPFTTNIAVQALYSHCTGDAAGGAILDANRGITWSDGNVAAYVCNYSTRINSCYGDKVDGAIQHFITNQCGSFHSGWDTVWDRGVVYGFTSTAQQIC